MFKKWINEPHDFDELFLLQHPTEFDYHLFFLIEQLI